MAQRSTYTPNRGRGAHLGRAVDAGLIAAANIVTRDVKLRFRERAQGYTTGDYAHTMGGVASTITQSAPHDHNGVRRILVGTNKRSPEGYSYPLAWELGHVNLFMGGQGTDASSIATRNAGSYQRVETFRPALDENRDKIKAAFGRTFKRFLRMPVQAGGASGE
jgi:hypothetical protein